MTYPSQVNSPETSLIAAIASVQLSGGDELAPPTTADVSGKVDTDKDNPEVSIVTTEGNKTIVDIIVGVLQNIFSFILK